MLSSSQDDTAFIITVYCKRKKNEVFLFCISCGLFSVLKNEAISQRPFPIKDLDSLVIFVQELILCKDSSENPVIVQLACSQYFPRVREQKQKVERHLFGCWVTVCFLISFLVTLLRFFETFGRVGLQQWKLTYSGRR